MNIQHAKSTKEYVAVKKPIFDTLSLMQRPGGVSIIYHQTPVT